MAVTMMLRLMLNLHRSAPDAGVFSTTSMSGDIVFGSVGGTSTTTSTDVELDALHTGDRRVISMALTEPNEDDVDRNKEVPERKAEASLDINYLDDFIMIRWLLPRRVEPFTSWLKFIRRLNFDLPGNVVRSRSFALTSEADRRTVATE
ncbi:hypothetical protein V5O48_011017, partial [Marasmius crinis-equi]